jgi:nitroreductase
MDEWLTAARNRVAAAAGLDPSSLELTQEEVDEILELARVAAHESGERINAPLLCYLVGVAHARRGGDLADLVDAAIAKPS